MLCVVVLSAAVVVQRVNVASVLLSLSVIHFVLSVSLPSFVCALFLSDLLVLFAVDYCWLTFALLTNIHIVLVSPL